MAKHIVLARDPKTLVLQPSGLVPWIHGSEVAATTEAQRLAGEVPGTEFLVLELKTVSKSVAVSTQRL